MTYTTVLVHAESNPQAAERLTLAAQVARKFDATLLGVGVEMVDWMGLSDPYGMVAAEWVALAREQVDKDLATAEALFRSHAGAGRHEWLALSDAPAPALSRTARRADLIVAGCAPLDDTAPLRTADAAELILQSGRPVLVAPPGAVDLRAERVLVAWKDSREARRATADALPFLKRAEEVVVMEVCDAEGVYDAEQHTLEVARHLQGHGVTARPRVKVAEAARAGVELNIEAEAIGADLIVSGAYGHSRLQEWVLGGVTREFLRRPERFVLFSH